MCSQTWNILTIAGHMIGLEMSVSQLCTGHSPLLAAYLHHTGRRHSATGPYCNANDEMAEHLVLHYLVHDQAWRESWLNLYYQSDPRCLWSFLERIGVVTHSSDRKWERQTVQYFWQQYMHNECSADNMQQITTAEFGNRVSKTHLTSSFVWFMRLPPWIKKKLRSQRDVISDSLLQQADKPKINHHIL